MLMSVITVCDINFIFYSGKIVAEIRVAKIALFLFVFLYSISLNPCDRGGRSRKK